ncbi:MAG: hypothetical protein ACXVJW_19005 [Acidimicrobiia bacterium]
MSADRGDAEVVLSVSTWLQPMPPAPGARPSAGAQPYDPLSFVDVVIDNTDIDRPRLVRPAD